MNRDAAKISCWGTRVILGKEYECQIGDNYTSWGSKWRRGMWFNEEMRLRQVRMYKCPVVDRAKREEELDYYVIKN